MDEARSDEQGLGGNRGTRGEPVLSNGAWPLAPSRRTRCGRHLDPKLCQGQYALSTERRRCNEKAPHIDAAGGGALRC